MRRWIGVMVSAVGCCFVLAALAQVSPPAAQAADEPAPPADQTYMGTKNCSACHFKQYLAFKKTAHSKAFETLTAKYQSDAKCLKCHTTGYGEETGFKDAASTPSLIGVGCESCHGPGSVHGEVGQKYANIKELSAAQEAELRDSIWLMLPKNVCVECHNQQAHKPSDTPPELRASN